MDQDYEPFVFYSTSQQRVLAFLPLATAPLSVIGSGLILHRIWVEREKTLTSPYHRIILGMSVLDFLNSLSVIVLGPWAVAEEASDYVVGARGTFRTCTVAGFFLNLLFGTMWYSAFLSLYFLLVINWNCLDSSGAVHYLEVTGHTVGLLVPLITGSIGAAVDLFNPMSILPGFCWFWRFPPECDLKLEDPSNPEYCMRGRRLMNVSGVGGTFFIILVFSIVTCCMIAITLKVQRIERRMSQYAGGRSSQMERTKATAVQSLLYIAAFFLTFGPIALSQILYDTRDETYYFVVACLAKFFAPLQGFWNFWIYMRRRIQRLVREQGGVCCCMTVCFWFRKSQVSASDEAPAVELDEAPDTAE